ncbi:uncharacterized protein si:cabz01074944.1 [Astyanax mexicanus]|uniref:uncharacterized protein si:cabz01074944.1 n=1 Tax=Astyanax mexicanus TaxID=7994 RepID=UPI0020CB6755|nr:uncharacterized protein si:cabz01074944.1 [Astyanax mexicanus]
MTSLYGYRVFYSGVVLLVFSYGVSVLAEEKTPLERRAAAGSSLILTLGNPNDSVSFAQWRYNTNFFATYRNKQLSITNVLQFSGRLKVNSDDLSVEVTDLQLSDSGRYSIVSEKSPGDQHPTETIILTVYDVVKVEIKSEQTWKAATNSCDVHLQCRAPEDQTVSYRWRGFKEEDGAQLNFTLKPEEGDVTLNCTASGSTGNGSNTTTVKCTPKKPPIGKPDDPSFDMQVIWIAAAGGGAALLLIFAITGLTCWWKSHKEQDLADPGSTVYEDVNVEGTLRKQSINIASIYETVDEHRIAHDKPQTLYDKVTFARPPPSLPSMPLPASQYQHVL